MASIARPKAFLKPPEFYFGLWFWVTSHLPWVQSEHKLPKPSSGLQRVGLPLVAHTAAVICHLPPSSLGFVKSDLKAVEPKEKNGSILGSLVYIAIPRFSYIFISSNQIHHPILWKLWACLPNTASTFTSEVSPKSSPKYQHRTNYL